MKKILSTTLILFTLLLAACSVSKSVLPAQASPVVPITGNEPKVDISGFAFDPATITIKVGQSVTWTNLDSAAHTVTADDNSWKSDNLDQGGTFSRAFTTAGTYTYHCSIHVEMKGSVIVQP
jgi:plastocyanin